MKHYVIRRMDYELYVVMSVPTSDLDTVHRLLPPGGQWYPVFVREDYESAEKTCIEMNQVCFNK